MNNSVYEIYRRELRLSVGKALRGSPTPESKVAFSQFIPLWTLIDGFRNARNTPDPTKMMLLSHLREQDDLSNFVKVARDYHMERNYKIELQGAYQATVFTSYFEELVSDSLLFLNSFHFNDYRGCMIALRCMLEDLYRHLYYKDNREYFNRVHNLGESEHDLKLSPAAFRVYLEGASYLSPLNVLNWNYSISGKNVKGIQKLNGALYAKTSSFVHGSLPRTLNGFASNLDFVFDKKKADEVLDISKMVCELCVAFLCSAHLYQFSSFNDLLKRTVLDAFIGAKRAAFRTALRI